jgi:hypothetical protein
VMLLFTCTTNVMDKTDYIHRALVKEVTKKNDSTIVLYMDLIDSGLVHNVRMVEYKAKVPNVFNCITKLSFITNKYGGYISSDQVKNNQLNKTSKKVKEDSSLLITQYYTSNTIMLRIPHFYMDTALKEINENLEFIDYKYSKVNDSFIGLYTASSYLQRLNQSYSEGISFQKWEGEINYDKLIDEYTSNYGAVILSIYQNPEIRVEKIGIPKLMEEYRTPFFVQTRIELGQGLKLISTFWFFALRYWPIIALLLLTTILLWINHDANKHYVSFRNWFDSPKS